VNRSTLTTQRCRLVKISYRQLISGLPKLNYKLESDSRKMTRSVDEMYPMVMDFDERLVVVSDKLA